MRWHGGIGWPRQAMTLTSMSGEPFTGALLFPYVGHVQPVYAVAWLPSDKRVASGGADQSVHIWDGENGHHIYTYHGHTRAVLGIAWSPDGSQIASCSADNTVEVWSYP